MRSFDEFKPGFCAVRIPSLWGNGKMQCPLTLTNRQISDSQGEFRTFNARCRGKTCRNKFLVEPLLRRYSRIVARIYALKPGCSDQTFNFGNVVRWGIIPM